MFLMSKVPLYFNACLPHSGLQRGFGNNPEVDSSPEGWVMPQAHVGVSTDKTTDFRARSARKFPRSPLRGPRRVPRSKETTFP